MKLQKIKFFNVKGAVFIMNKLKIQIFFTFVLFGMLSTHLKARIRKKYLKSKGRILAARACLSKGRGKGTARALAHQLYIGVISPSFVFMESFSPLSLEKSGKMAKKGKKSDFVLVEITKIKTKQSFL